MTPVATRTSGALGLSSAEAAARLAAHGPNVLPVAPRTPAWRRLAAEERLQLVVDRGTFRERDAEVGAADPLAFHDKVAYRERLAAARGGNDALTR